MIKRINIVCIVLAGLIFSCVPARQFNDLKDKFQKCEEERTQLKDQYKAMEVKNTEMASEIEQLKKQVKILVSDSAMTGKSSRNIQSLYDKILQLNKELERQNKELLHGNRSETGRIQTELQSTKDKLLKKEDELKELERKLSAESKELEELKAELDKRVSELEEKNAKLIELQNILNRKDSVVKALKNKVTNALMGYEGDELSVEMKNGKVYVKLEEKLLFKSGSTKVDPKGVQALKKLSKVFEQNTDINIMIEGHTDDVPYTTSSGSIKDNWDLSVLRATSIVRILTEGTTIDPQRITVAGRGEHLPLEPAKTKEARQKNRRTEIILTPKLDELLKILE